jgi:hypothetical protein
MARIVEIAEVMRVDPWFADIPIFDDAKADLIQQIEQALGAVITQVAQSRGINFVVPRQLVIFNEPGFDITDEVAAQLNRVLRQVNLPPEGEMPAPAAARAPAAPAAGAPRQPAPAAAQPRPAQQAPAARN